MIASLGGDVKPLALSPTPSHCKLVGDVKEPTSLFDKSRGRSPRCAVWPFHSFTSRAMGWVGSNEINNGLHDSGSQRHFYMLTSHFVVKI